MWVDVGFQRNNFFIDVRADLRSIQFPIMDSTGAEPTTVFHVVAMPFPCQGHINALMSLCKLLSFEQLLDRLEPPVARIIADFELQWSFGVGIRRNIPLASLWTMSASFFSSLHHYHVFAQAQPQLLPLHLIGLCASYGILSQFNLVPNAPKIEGGEY
ncbi:udp-glycosyltransferase 87a1 [Quercus suber]|uniref:Udp-glycosyltransferase 87a1 n=1 Tax=Quercus suber TaxID=58331 RepID=A0AAW0M1W5_QUESU